MESLFKFSDVSRVQRVLKNYPDLRGDSEQGLDLHTKEETHLGDLRDKLEQDVGDVSVFMRSKLWSEKEDLLLAQNFEKAIVQDGVFKRLKGVLRATLHSDKTTAQIRKRVNYLELHQLSEHQAVIKIQTLHSGKLNFQRVLRLVLRPLNIQQRKLYWMQFVQFITTVIHQFAQFKSKFSDSLQEFSILPQTDLEFQALFLFQSVLQSMDLINPLGKRAFWRIPNYVSADQLLQRIQKFQSIFDNLGFDLKSKNKYSQNSIDNEFGDLIDHAEEFNFDVGAQNTQDHSQDTNKRRTIREGSDHANTKQTGVKFSKKRKGLQKLKNSKKILKNIPESKEIEGLISDNGSVSVSLESVNSSIKENVEELKSN